MQMTTNEYRQFLSTFEATNKWMFDWMGAHIKEGVTFPYHPSELLTNIKFQEGSIHIMMEAKQQLADFLEDEFWRGANIKRSNEKY